MEKKSELLERFLKEKESSHISYYDPDEYVQLISELVDYCMIDDALDLAKIGLRLHPNNEDVEKQTIWLYIHHGSTVDAENLLKKYRNDGTSDSCCLVFEFEAKNGNPSKALKVLFEQLSKKIVEPYDWITAITNSYNYLPTKELNKLLVKSGKIIDDDAEVLQRIGSMLSNNDQFEEAIPILEKSLDLDAYEIYVWKDLSRCYLALSDYSKCLEACDFGLAIEKDDPMLCYTKGYIYYTRKDYKNAIKYIQIAKDDIVRQIEELGDEEIDDILLGRINLEYQVLGLSYIEVNELEKAKECFLYLVDLNPNNPEMYMQLASVYLLMGDLSKAKDCISSAITNNPEDTASKAMKVSVLTTLGDYEGALKELEVLIEQCPDSETFLLAYAELSQRLNHDEDADKTFRKLLEFGDLSENAQTLLLNYFESIGDNEAIKLLK